MYPESDKILQDRRGSGSREDLRQFPTNRHLGENLPHQSLGPDELIGMDDKQCVEPFLLLSDEFGP